MENNRQDLLNLPEDWEYSVKDFYEDVVCGLERCDIDSSSELYNRDSMNKLKVLQSLLFMELPQYDPTCNNDEEVINAITNSVTENELLFNYTFYLSSNRDFNYTWSYLRKKLDAFVGYLFDSYKFIGCLLNDVTQIRQGLKNCSDLYVNINNTIDVKFLNESPYVETNIIWKNFHSIIKDRKGYDLSIRLGETTVMGFHRKYRESLNSIIDTLNELTNSINNAHSHV